MGYVVHTEGVHSAWFRLPGPARGRARDTPGQRNSPVPPPTSTRAYMSTAAPRFASTRLFTIRPNLVPASKPPRGPTSPNAVSLPPSHNSRTPLISFLSPSFTLHEEVDPDSASEFPLNLKFPPSFLIRSASGIVAHTASPSSPTSRTRSSGPSTAESSLSSRVSAIRESRWPPPHSSFPACFQFSPLPLTGERYRVKAWWCKWRTYRRGR